MEVKGYKAFNIDRTNRYGMKFIEGNIYTIDGDLKFGNNGNGYHFCKNLEDTFRYFRGFNIEVAEVTSLGEIHEFSDDYYGYYDLYVARELRIDRFLTREEIINKYLNESEYKVKRFLATFILTDEEKELFKLQYNDNINIMKTFYYYQEMKLDIYEKEYKSLKKKL
jgi:hypothetical protein